MIASLEDHLDVVQYLVSQGAQVERGNNANRTPLHHASSNGHLEVIQYLVTQGAQVERGDDDRGSDATSYGIIEWAS